MVIPRVLAKVMGNLHQSHCRAGGPGRMGGSGQDGDPPFTLGIPPWLLAVQMAPAQARAKVLPADKKLSLANSEFAAWIFIFPIPVPSAPHRCPMSLALSYEMLRRSWEDLGFLQAWEHLQCTQGHLDGCFPFHETPQKNEEGLEEQRCPWSQTLLGMGTRCQHWWDRSSTFLITGKINQNPSKGSRPLFSSHAGI